MPKLPKIKPPSKIYLTELFRSRKIYFLAVVVIVAVGVFIYFADDDFLGNKQEQRATEQKLDNLDKQKELTCQQVLSEVGQIQADKIENKETKKKLLERQVYCFSGLEQFDQAISAAEQLKAIYKQEDDLQKEEQTNRAIAEMKSVRAEIAEDAKNRQNNNENSGPQNEAE